MFRPHSLGRALDGLEVRGRRHASLNQKMYGAALAVPLGLTTRTSAGTDTVAEALAALSRGRAEVLEVLPEPGRRRSRRAGRDARRGRLRDR